MRLETHDPMLADLISEDAEYRHLACGFKFTEGPVWRSGEVIFSDIPSNRLVRYRTLVEGPEVQTFRHPSNNSNGNTLDKQNRLITCEHSGRRVSRTEPDGSITELATHYEGKRLNSPNDVVVRSDGAIFFTDPPYGLKNRSEGKELPFNGVYRIDADGSLHVLVDDFGRPNGLAFSPDESVLYIGDSERKHIRAFDVTASGELSNGRMYIDMSQSQERGTADGMKVDSRGNLWSTGPGAIWVIAPSGKLLGKIVLPEVAANCAWGDPDWQTLYMTAQTGLYSVRVKVPGIPVGSPVF